MKKIVSLFILCFIICGIFTSCTTNPSNEVKFTNWVDGSNPIAQLKEYVEEVTNEKSENYIPVEDRIAVFDLDGTLYCETFPIYGEWLLFAEYVLNTPGYEASEEILAVAEELVGIKKASDIPSHMEQTHIYAHAKAFAGMTIKDYMSVVDDFKKTNAEGFNNMTRGEAFYLPMLEVVEYLLDNEFIVYICSGTNRFTVRALIDGVIDIPARQVIGTDFTIVASGQGDEMDMHYNYTEDDELLMGDTVITKNVKMSKVAQLEQELGQKPVLVLVTVQEMYLWLYMLKKTTRILQKYFSYFVMIHKENMETNQKLKRLRIFAKKRIGLQFQWQMIGLQFTEKM